MPFPYIFPVVLSYFNWKCQQLVFDSKINTSSGDIIIDNYQQPYDFFFIKKVILKFSEFNGYTYNTNNFTCSEIAIDKNKQIIQFSFLLSQPHGSEL